VELRVPSLGLLPDYVRAIERGWCPDNFCGREAADEELVRIASDPEGFVASLDDPEGRNPPIQWVDGTIRPRLPSYRRWIWADGFCGLVGLRWWGEGDGLPEWFPYGHVGYSVLEWKRRRGYASAAVSLILDDARARGLTWVEVTTNADNIPSQGVVLKNSGLLWARENGGPPHRGADIIRWRIML
jgi:predicted acetyltransferase